MLQTNVGHGSTAAPDMVLVGVSPGETVNVVNTADEASVDCFIDGVNGIPIELGPGDAVDLVAPAWLRVVGAVGSVQISGGIYGDGPSDA